MLCQRVFLVLWKKVRSSDPRCGMLLNWNMLHYKQCLGYLNSTSSEFMLPCTAVWSTTYGVHVFIHLLCRSFRSGPTIASPNRAGLRTLFGSQGLTSTLLLFFQGKTSEFRRKMGFRPWRAFGDVMVGPVLRVTSLTWSTFIFHASTAQRQVPNWTLLIVYKLPGLGSKFAGQAIRQTCRHARRGANRRHVCNTETPILNQLAAERHAREGPQETQQHLHSSRIWLRE